MCAEQDSNLRSLSATDLQSVVIDHSTIDAYFSVYHLPLICRSIYLCYAAAVVCFFFFFELEENEYAPFLSTSTSIVAPFSISLFTIQVATGFNMSVCIFLFNGRAPYSGIVCVLCKFVYCFFGKLYHYFFFFQSFF